MDLSFASDSGKRGHPVPAVSAFTLLEVLAALALCMLLASVTATAVMHSGGAARRAVRLQDQALRLRTLHAQARLHPDLLQNAAIPSSSAWRVAQDERITPPPPLPPSVSRLSDRPPSPPPPRRWTVATLHDSSATLRPVQLTILETAP